MVTAPSLTDWVTAWAARYPSDGDNPVCHLFGADELGRDDWLVVVDWKLQSDNRWRGKTTAALEQEPDERLRALAPDAKACRDDLAALRVVCAAPGVGDAVCSALLTVMDPRRFSITDVLARKSIRGLARNHSFTDPAWVGHWRNYLDACRRLAEQCGVELRTVDHALFAANGAMGLPDDD